MTGQALPLTNGISTEDLSQLEFELGRSAARSDREALARTADELLSFRLRWLLATARSPEGAVPWVSELEYGRFLEAAGSAEPPDARDGPERTVGDRLRPVTGVSWRSAQDFCAWFSGWSERFGEPARVRLPSVAEARRAPGGTSPSRWLDALSGDAEVGAWCGDERRLVCLRPPGGLAGTGRLVSTLLRLDAWFLFHLGLWDWLRARMPVRVDDADFNENYEGDRRFVEQYAARLRCVRDALVHWDERRGRGLGIARRLDFEPLRDLSGTSPLDGQRDRIVDACRLLRAEIARHAGVDPDPWVPALAEMDVTVLGPADVDRLALAIGRLGERGVDSDMILDRIAPLSVSTIMPGVKTRSTDTVGRLQRLLAPGPGREGPDALDHAQWHALEAWAASGEVPATAGGWWSRLFRRRRGPHRARPRDVLASVYCDLVVMAERRRGRSAPFEGIRLVRDDWTTCE